MKNFGFLNIQFMLCLFSIDASCERTNIESENIQWNMVKKFAKKHKVKNWTIYPDNAAKDSKWYKFCFNAMKNGRDLGNFITCKPQFQNSLNLSKATREHKLKKKETRHLHVYPNLESMIELVNLEATLILKSNQPSSNILLIRIPENEKKQIFWDTVNNFQLSSVGKIFFFFLYENGSIIRYENSSINGTNLHKANVKSNLVFNSYGTWNNEHGFLDKQKNTVQPHLSLEGSHLRVLSAYSPPAVTYIEDGCTSKDCFKGILANAFHVLSDQMNFTYTIKKTYMWGSVTNGTWNGMVGMLNDKLADIAVTDLTITSARSTVVDFLPALMEISEELYMKNPGDAFSTVSYIGSFTKSAWTAIIVWMVIVPIILIGIVGYEIIKSEKDRNFLKCFVMVSASIVNLSYVLKSGSRHNNLTKKQQKCFMMRSSF